MLRIDTPQGPLSYAEKGSGPVLLLVHGFPLDHTMWSAHVDPLAGSFRVITPDLPGFGESPPQEAVMTMASFADSLVGLLDALGAHEPVILGALSMGGYVALALWQAHAARVRGMILADTRATADEPDAARDRLAAAERVLAEGGAFLIDGMVPKLFAPGAAQTMPGTVEQVRSMMLRAAPAGVAAALRGMAERPDMTAALAGIDVPVLALCGSEDVITPPAGMHAMVARLPHARYIEIPGAGHMAPMEAPEAVTVAMGEWLAGLK